MAGKKKFRSDKVKTNSSDTKTAIQISCRQMQLACDIEAQTDDLKCPSCGHVISPSNMNTRPTEKPIVPIVARDAPMPKRPERPRSRSRAPTKPRQHLEHRARLNNTAFSDNIKPVEQNGSPASLSSSAVSLPSCPPPPPPLPAFLTGKGKTIVTTKPTSKYEKKQVTDTIMWESICANNNNNTVDSKKTVWDQFTEPEFPETLREKLEANFGRSATITPNSVRVATANANKFMRASLDRAGWQGLSEKRALTLSVILKKFKLPTSTLVELVDKLDLDQLQAINLDQLQTLLLNYPKDEELLFYKRLSTSEDLQEADMFCYDVAKRPLFKHKLEILVLRSTVPPELENYNRLVSLINAGVKALTETFDGPIKNLLFKTLQCGNFLNQNSYASEAGGFMLNSLLSSLSTKGKSDLSGRLRMIDIIAESTPDLKELLLLKPILQSAMGNDLQEMTNSVLRSKKNIADVIEKLDDSENWDKANIVSISQEFEDLLTKCTSIEDKIQEMKDSESRLCEYYQAVKWGLNEIFDCFAKTTDMLDNSFKEIEQRHRAELIRNSPGRSTVIGIRSVDRRVTRPVRPVRTELQNANRSFADMLQLLQKRH